MIKMDSEKIQQYCYYVRLKDFILSLMNLTNKLEDYSVKNKEIPSLNTILSWVIESYVSQISEIYAKKEDYQSFKQILEELEQINNRIKYSKDHYQLKSIMDKFRELSIKIMTNIANLYEELNL